MPGQQVGKSRQRRFQFVGLADVGQGMGFDEAGNLRVEHLEDGLDQVVAAEETLTLLVDDRALAVDDVVKLDDVLADVEVVAFDAGLGGLDGAGDDLVLDRDIVVHSEPVHDAGDAVGAEAAHQFIFQRDEETRVARVALAAGTAAELVVDAARFVALGADDVQAAQLGDAFAELDVGTATGHVGGDRDRAGLAG